MNKNIKANLQESAVTGKRREQSEPDKIRSANNSHRDQRTRLGLGKSTEVVTSK